MISNRKIIIWLFSLAGVLVLYFLFTSSSVMPKIAIDKSSQQWAADSNAPSSSGVGMVGDVGVGAVQKAKYTHLNNKKEVDREFGFEKLLHEVGDEWEIEQPFMNIYRRNLECKITADSGRVQVQNIGGRPSPKDASLSGNVVIHITPLEDSSVSESFIYLDDIIFISEKSQFSTAGAVRFVNANASLIGRGMELIYNEQTGRLDFFRIMRVDDLSLKVPAKKEKDESSSDSGRLQTASMDSSPSGGEIIQIGEPTAEKAKSEEYYKCSLSGNVVINSPEQLVFADEVLISDILYSKGKRAKDSAKDNAASADNTGKQSEPNMPEEFTDIKVSCDNGILVTPRDSEFVYETAAAAGQDAESAADRSIRIAGESDKRATFAADRVEYNMADSSVVLEGDCLCTGFQYDVGGMRKHTLSGEKISVTLSRDKEEKTFAWAEGIERIVAEGGVVQLATIKMADDKILGFSKLKCSQFEYDGDGDKLTATGPGVIAIDNSKLLFEPKKGKDRPGKFALKRQCYAVVRDFETLVYSLKSNQLIADNTGGGLVIDYFPVVNGKTGTQVTVNAGHIEAQLATSAGGGTELTKLIATEGVTYEEKDIQFAGSDLIYDAASSLINIKGDGNRPCLLNGSIVDGIRYDLKKDKFKAEVKSPGILWFK